MANKDFKIKGELSTPYVKEFVAPSSSAISNGGSPSLIGPTYVTRYVDFVSSNANILGLFFKPDGTKFYVLDSAKGLFEYSLSTAFDLTTATQLNSVTLTTDSSTITSLCFSSDGYYFYVMSYSDHHVRQYSLTTAWDTSSVATDDTYNNFYFGGEFTFAASVAFDSTGEFFTVIKQTGGNAATYQCSTNWDITTASLFGSNVFPNSSYSYQSAYGPDNKLFINGYNDFIYEVSGSSVSVADMTFKRSYNYYTGSGNLLTASYGFAFNDNFTKMFLGAASGDIYEFACSADAFTVDLSNGSCFNFTASNPTEINVINPSNSTSLTTGIAVIEGATGVNFGWGTNVILDVKAQVTPSANTTNVYGITSGDGGTSVRVASIITGAA